LTLSHQLPLLLQFKKFRLQAFAQGRSASKLCHAKRIK
jgi:hypothetical protein